MNGSTPSPLPAVPAAPVAAPGHELGHYAIEFFEAVAVAPAPPVPTPPMVRPASAPAVPVQISARQCLKAQCLTQVGPALAPPAPPQSPPMPTAPSFARPVPASALSTRKL